MIVVDCKVLHCINDEDQEALGYKTLWRSNTVASHIEILIRSSMLVLKNLLGYRTQRRTRNAARTLSSVGEG